MSDDYYASCEDLVDKNCAKIFCNRGYHKLLFSGGMHISCIHNRDGGPGNLHQSILALLLLHHQVTDELNLQCLQKLHILTTDPAQQHPWKQTTPH